MAKFQPPDLSNATPEMLADEMGKLSIVENYVKKLRGFYKEAYFARMGIKVEDYLNGQATTFAGGDTFIATTTRSDPNRINQDKLKTDYPDAATACLESKPQLTTRFSLKEGVVNPVVTSLLEDMKKELDLD
jgi:hypothetical protein